MCVLHFITYGVKPFIIENPLHIIKPLDHTFLVTILLNDEFTLNFVNSFYVSKVLRPIHFHFYYKECKVRSNFVRLTKLIKYYFLVLLSVVFPLTTEFQNPQFYKVLSLKFFSLFFLISIYVVSSRGRSNDFIGIYTLFLRG